MMPDFDQSGLPETKEWVPEQAAPVPAEEAEGRGDAEVLRVHAESGGRLTCTEAR